MILPVVKYGHPALRQKGARVEKLSAPVKKLIADMFETMYEARGVGLAAQQIGQALQVAVIDVSAVTDRPSTLQINGQPADVDSFMPLAIINPEITPVGKPEAGPEGCLSFPEMYADITRPESIDVIALNQTGERIQFRCGGLLARAIQHEADHLNGILFIDRMTREDKEELKPKLEELRIRTRDGLSPA